MAQGKLLRALQERDIERVGGTRLIKVDVRVIAATNVDLKEEVAAGRFREDLLFRLNVFPIHLPPLKERRDDIPLLMDVFLRRYCVLHGRDIPGFTPRAVRALLQYEFPGNIRELQNLIERGVIMADEGNAIDVHHLSRSGELLEMGSLGVTERGQLAAPDLADEASQVRSGKSRRPESKIDGISRDPDVQTYRKALAAARYNVSKAAKSLNLTRAQLAYRLKVAGIR